MPLELQEISDDQATVFDADKKKSFTINRSLISPKTWEQVSTLEKRIEPFKDAPKVGQSAETKQKIIDKTLMPALEESESNVAPAAEQQQPQIVVAPVAMPTQQPPQITAPTVTQAQSVQKVETKMGAEQKKAFEAFSEANKAVTETSLKTAEFEIEKAKEIGLAKTKLADENMVKAAEIEKTYMDRQAQLAQQEAKIRSTQDELKNYKFKEFFEGREGSRIMAAISVGLGAIGSSITKGPNYAMQIIENAIQNDLALQKANYDKLKGTLEADQSLYGQLVRKLGDEFQASQQFMNIRNNAVSQKIEAASTMVSDQEGKAKLDQMRAQLQQKSAQAAVDATKGLDIKVMTETKPMVMPSAKETATAGKEIEEYVAKTPLKEAMDVESARKQFKAMVQAGASPQAIANFIAGPSGLGQGSYGPTFETMLKQAGLVDRTVEGIQEFVSGEKSASVIRGIQNFLDAKSIESAARSKPYLQEFEVLNERAGRGRTLYTDQVNPVGLQREAAKAAGLMPRAKK